VITVFILQSHFVSFIISSSFSLFQNWSLVFFSLATFKAVSSLIVCLIFFHSKFAVIKISGEMSAEKKIVKQQIPSPKFAVKFSYQDLSSSNSNSTTFPPTSVLTSFSYKLFWPSRQIGPLSPRQRSQWLTGVSTSSRRCTSLGIFVRSVTLFVTISGEMSTSIAWIAVIDVVLFGGVSRVSSRVFWFFSCRRSRHV